MKKIILIALLAITNGVTFWMYTQEKNKAANEVIVKEQVIVERDNVKGELLQLQKDYGNLQKCASFKIYFVHFISCRDDVP